MKANQPTLEFFKPIARSMPCTGNGVNTSQRVNPASRTFSAACMMSAAVVNSTMTPYGFEEVPFILVFIVGHRFQMFGTSEQKKQNSLRRHAFHFRNRNHRQVTQEQQE